MPKSKAELDARRKKFLSLKQVAAMPGWEIVRQMLKDEFNEAIETASESNDSNKRAEARGAIKFIKRFTDTLRTEMGFGEKAQKEYVERYINPPKDEKSDWAKEI